MDPRDNRYAPPRTRELELPDEAPREMPRHVDWTCRLLWTGVGISILSAVLSAIIGPPIRLADIVAELIGLAIGLAIAFWFIIKVRAGRNWMRLLITILNAVGLACLGIVLAMLLPTAFGKNLLAEMLGEAPVETWTMLVQFLLGAIEMVLLNTPSSRAWFAARKFSS